MNNPYWPLPSNYGEVKDPRERKRMRLAVLLDRSTPAKYVAAWHLFRNYYLNHEQAGFYKDFTPSPPIHVSWVQTLRADKKFVMIAAPRGFSKSTVMGKEVPLLEVVAPTKPNMEVGLILAKDEFVEDRMDELMTQITGNERIIEDFGNLQPMRGKGRFNHHTMKLTNGCRLKGVSMDGIKRGLRPDLLIVDDPETDPKQGTNIERVMEDLRNALTREIIPMLPPLGRIIWIGTLLHRRSFLYHMFHGRDDAFDNGAWAKYFSAADWMDQATGERKLLWKERFSAEVLEERKRIIGVGAYKGEYCNDPMSDSESLFQIDQVLNEYDFAPGVNLDWTNWPSEQDNPLTSETPLIYYDCGVDDERNTIPTEMIVKFGDHVSRMRRFAFVDYAPTDKPTSDYSAIVVVGLDSRNTLWVLDAWQDRVRPDALMRQIWAYGNKWNVEYIGIESVSIQSGLADQVRDTLTAMPRGDSYWYPRVLPVKYSMKISKSDRIASLEWRFRKGRIKLPAFARTGNHTLARLYDQLFDFTMDLSRLPKDDLVDALSFFHYSISGSHTVMDVPSVKLTPTELIMAGHVYFPGTNIELSSALATWEWTPELMNKFDELRGKREEEDQYASERGVHHNFDQDGDDGWLT